MYLEKKYLPPQLQHLHTAGKIRAEACETVNIPNDAGTWSGGTCQLFSAVELATGAVKTITDTFSPPWDASRLTRIVMLRPGYAIAETGSFCGKPAGLRLYLHPQDLAPLVPAPATLSPIEWEVLDVVCALKSAYRSEEFIHRRLSPDKVAEAKISLVLKGLLDTRGAVTAKGRNARSGGRPSPVPSV